MSKIYGSEKADIGEFKSSRLGIGSPVDKDYTSDYKVGDIVRNKVHIGRMIKGTRFCVCTVQEEIYEHPARNIMPTIAVKTISREYGYYIEGTTFEGVLKRFNAKFEKVTDE